MPRLLILLMLFPFITTCFAENLVKNPSFEEGLPEKTIRKRNGAGTDAIYPTSWTSPSLGTPDLFNSPYSSGGKLSCAIARTGSGVMGMVMAESKNLENYYGGSYKEYIQGELSSPLEAGKAHRVRFWIAHDRTSRFTAKNIGACFSNDPIRTDNHLHIDREPHVKMQDSMLVTAVMGWTKVEGVFVAKGGERFITIGSFGKDFMIPISSQGMAPLVTKGHTHRNAYYYIDDITVESAEELRRHEKSELSSLIFLFDPSHAMPDRAMLEKWKKSFLALENVLPPETLISVFLAGNQARSLCEREPVPIAMQKINTSIEALIPSQGTESSFDKVFRSVVQPILSKPKDNEHIIALFQDKQKMTGDTRSLMKKCYDKYDITFSVVQWGGKEINDFKGLINYCEGQYFMTESDPQFFMRDAALLGVNHKNVVHYSKDRSGKMLYYIGAGALVALIIGSAL